MKKQGIQETQEYNIPKEEIIEVRFVDDRGLVYVITRHPYINERYLYQIKDGVGKKIETEQNPNDFKAIQKLKKEWDKMYKEEEEI